MNVSQYQTCSLFHDMEINNIQILCNDMQAYQQSYKKGSYIAHPGDEIHAIAMIEEGRVSIEQEDFMGNRNLLTTLHPFDVFNEVFACAKEKTNVHVACETDTTILFLNIENILHGVYKEEVVTQFMRNLLQTMAQKNLMLNMKVTHLTKRSMEDKVISYLSSQAQFHNSNSFTIPFNRQQLADYLSVDRSALSNTLSKLQDKGYLKFHKNHFTILPQKK